MALDAGVAGLHVIHPRRTQDIFARWMLHVFAPRPMTLLASHIPLRHPLGVNVVVHRMAAIASRSRRPLHVVRWIKRLPPVRSFGHEIRPPHAMSNVPLRGLRIIIIPNFCEVALLPKAAVT